jgi:hypothetical protein
MDSRVDLVIELVAAERDPGRERGQQPIGTELLGNPIDHECGRGREEPVKILGEDVSGLESLDRGRDSPPSGDADQDCDADGVEHIVEHPGPQPPGAGDFGAPDSRRRLRGLLVNSGRCARRASPMYRAEGAGRRLCLAARWPWLPRGGFVPPNRP